LKFYLFFTQNRLKTRIADGRKHQSLINEKNIFYLQIVFTKKTVHNSVYRPFADNRVFHRLSLI